MMDGAEEKLQRRPTAYSGDQEGGGCNWRFQLTFSKITCEPPCMHATQNNFIQTNCGLRCCLGTQPPKQRIINWRWLNWIYIYLISFLTSQYESMERKRKIERDGFRRSSNKNRAYIYIYIYIGRGRGRERERERENLIFDCSS
jgi:hypothetical protein